MTVLFLKSANHQIRHQATHKVGCQPGDCTWSLGLNIFYSSQDMINDQTEQKAMFSPLHGHFYLPPGFVWVCMD